MSGIWSLITGAKSIDKTLDIVDKSATSIFSGIDKAFYTDEEKSQTAVKWAELQMKLVEQTASETTTRSITRRVVAICIMALTFLSIIAVCVIWRLNPEWAKFILEVVQYFNIGYAFIGVVIFFFGNHMLTGIKK